MDQTLKSLIYESLTRHLINDLIIIIIDYIVSLNSEKFDREMCHRLHYPLGIVVNEKQIFISDRVNGQIVVYDKETDEQIYVFGKIGGIDNIVNYKSNIKSLDNVMFSHPTYLTINKNSLYVADSKNNVVQIFKIHSNKKVSFLDCFGKQHDKKIEHDELIFPFNIVIFNDDIYVSDIGYNKQCKINVYNKNKYVKTIMLNEGYIRYKVYGLSVNENFMYVSNALNNTLQIFDKQNYKLLREFNNFNNPRCNIITHNEIFIEDYWYNRINVYDLESFKHVRKIDKTIDNSYAMTIYNNEIYVLTRRNGCSLSGPFYYCCVFERFYDNNKN
jgi:hypothetical protein